MGGVFDIFPGYLKIPQPDRHRPRDISQTYDAYSFEAERVGLVQLLVEHTEVHGVVLEIALRRFGKERERFQL